MQWIINEIHWATNPQFGDPLKWDGQILDSYFAQEATADSAQEAIKIAYGVEKAIPLPNPKGGPECFYYSGEQIFVIRQRRPPEPKPGSKVADGEIRLPVRIQYNEVVDNIFVRLDGLIIYNGEIVITLSLVDGEDVEEEDDVADA